MPVKHGPPLGDLKVEIDKCCIEPGCDNKVVPGSLMCLEHADTIEFKREPENKRK